MRGGTVGREFSQKFDQWSPPQFRLTRDEIADCLRSLPPSTIDDIEFAQTQIHHFALAQRDCLRDLKIEPLPGVTLGRRNVSMNCAGRSLPGGRYPKEAAAHMNVLTAMNLGGADTVWVKEMQHGWNIFIRDNSRKSHRVRASDPAQADDRATCLRRIPSRPA